MIFWAVIGGGFLLFLLPLLFYLPSILVESEEERIEDAFHRGAYAAERRDYSIISDLISDSYDGDIGKDRAEAVKIAETVFDQLEGLRIKILVIEVTLRESEDALVQCQFEASGYWVGSGVYNRIPLSGGMPRPVPGEIKAGMKKESDAWRITHFSLVVNGHEYR